MPLGSKMVKIKGKLNREAPKAASPGVQAPEGTPKKSSRRATAASLDSHPNKRAKISPTPRIGNEEPPTAPFAEGKTIKIGGGAVDCQGLDKALRALCRHVQKLQQQEEAPDLLAGSCGPTVCLMFSLQNIPDRQRIIPHLIELPHSPLETGSEVCLIVRDPQRKWKDLVACTPSLSCVTRVISYKKLPKKFPQFADKRALCAGYDQFLVDTRVKEKAYNSLGKVFFSANKLPLPIRVGASTLEREVGKALRSTSLVIKRGPSVAVRIGKALAPPEELLANAVAAIRGVSDFFKNSSKWKNTVTTIHIQATNTPALPVYLHPKFAQAAELYSQTKPPSGDAQTGINNNEKQQKKAHEAMKTPNKVGETRRIKRGVREGDKKVRGDKRALKKALKGSKAQKPVKHNK